METEISTPVELEARLGRGLLTLADLDGLPPGERVATAHRIMNALQRMVDQTHSEMRAVIAEAAMSAPEEVSKSLGVSASMVERMSADPRCPDFPLLRSALRTAMFLRPLPVEAVRNVGKALQIQGSTDEDVTALCRLLLSVEEEAPFDGPAWAGISLKDQESFRQAVIYARSLLG
ncbi:hypothetical protein OG884_00250 [Streptosporangium sp. NBC_01755]|uniref:hypothetical protein n=1 Tax=Streptosporangium sp. NBC_01755 TaxID=2975949 RepID=UPI002DDBBD5B|nr:hypothetical protein [Streptosporangium sp. NBC_01755]WSD00414.1 hypothetical protein OG884_00250 [Streptosporangium sp. NBC_01755]